MYLIVALVFVALVASWVVFQRRRKAKLVTKDQLRPETSRAIDQGTMSNDQMVELLRATGWNARVKDGRIVVEENYSRFGGRRVPKKD